MARVTTRSLAGALYRGTQLFQSKRFFEAMFLLRNAFVLWRGSVDQLSSKERDQFYELCFMLGYCYDEMSQYDTGHYYLSLIDGTDNLAHVYEMVNNLANNNDPRVIGYIESLLNDIQRRYEEETGKHVNVYQAAQDSDTACLLLFSWPRASRSTPCAPATKRPPWSCMRSANIPNCLIKSGRSCAV